MANGENKALALSPTPPFRIEGALSMARPESQALSDQQYENLGIDTEWRIRAVLGLYPDDHLVSQYAHGLLGRLDDAERKISVYKGEPNAFILPNGSIYLSDQLILQSDYNEESLFVLEHERMHEQEEHLKSSVQTPVDLEATITSLVKHRFGQNRMQELEGDTKGFSSVADKQINPLGGIVLIEKMRQEEETPVSRYRKRSIDPVHGRSVDRALAMHGLTHLRNMPALNNPLTPVPQDVKDAIAAEQQDHGYDSPVMSMLDSMESGWYRKTVDQLKSFDLQQSLVALQLLLHRYDRDMRYADDAFYVQQAQFKRDFIPMLTAQIWEQLAVDVRAFDETYDRDQVTMIFHTILNATLGIDEKKYEDILFDRALPVHDRPSSKKYHWSEQFALGKKLATKEQVQKLPTVLNPALFTHLGLAVSSDPDSYVHTIVQTVLDNAVFEDEDFDTEGFVAFTQSMLHAVHNLYENQGTEAIDMDVVTQSVIDMVEYNFGQKSAEPINAALTKAMHIELQTEPVVATPEKAEDIKAAQAIIEVFKELSADRKLLMSKHDNKLVVPYQRKIQAIMTSRNPQNHTDLLRIMGQVRMALQSTPQTWQAHYKYDSYWNKALSPFFRYNKELSDQVTDGLELAFFNFKMMMLLAHDAASEVFHDYGDGVEPDFVDQPNFDLQWFQKFYEIATNPRALATELGVDITTDNVLESPLTDTIRHDFIEGKIVVLRNALTSSSREEFAQLLEYMTLQYPFNHYGTERLEFETQETTAAITKRKFLNELFKTYQFDLNDPDDLKSLYYVSTYLEDIALAVRLQNVIWEKFAEQFSFEEGFTFLEQELQAGRLLSVRAITEFAEKKARSHEEIASVGQRLEALMKLPSSMEGIGKLVMIEQLVDEFFKGDRLEFLKACIGNGQNDEQLKSYLYQRWVATMNFEPTLATDHIRLDEVMNKLYRLDAQSKFYLIKELLVGEGGILVDRNPKRRREFMNFFLDNYVVSTDETESAFFGVMRDVIDEIIQTADYDMLYFAIAPLLQDRILIPPPHRVSWIDIIKTEEPPQGFQKLDTSDRFEDMMIGYDTDNDDDYEAEYERRYGEISKQKVDENEAGTLYEYIIGKRKDAELIEYDQLQSEYESMLDALIRTYEPEAGNLKMTVNEFMLEGAQRVGAIGKRFLQLIGQYLELPPHLEELFNDVYDKVPGQLKFSADHTLLDQWPEAATKLAGLDEKIGGGSLMTVFKATETTRGKKRAVKILNPNTDYHTRKIHKLFTEVFTRLAQKDPAFAPAVSLLEDIREWISGDINFKGFIQLDKQFREQNNGFTTDNNRYHIKVPRSFPPENQYFAQDEFIEGTNLTELRKLQEEGHEPKQIAQLVIANFFMQLMNGTVHSDIHPGNIRVTEKNEVVWLDRNFYIQLNNKDKAFLMGMYASLSNPEAVIGQVFDYLEGEGTHFEDGMKEHIRSRVHEILGSDDQTNQLLHLAVLLRKEGVRFPLKITLLIKDIFYLDRLAKKVGFSSLADAMS